MLAALSNFEQAAQLEDSPRHCSYLAYSIARERGQLKRGITLCREAIAQEPDTSDHYLNLGRIQLLAGLKAEAIETFREGMRHQTNQKIVRELQKMEPRKPPVIAFLHRDNPLNKYLGIILARLGLRKGES